MRLHERFEWDAMKHKSTSNRTVHRHFREIAAAKPAELNRLKKAMAGPIDCSDIPAGKVGAHRVVHPAPSRRAAGQGSLLRDAILAELGRRQMTRYQLWRDAQLHCKTLSESAVYEFLRGQRQIGVLYIEAILNALSLRIISAAA